MNRSALKSLGILLLGAALGWGIGRLPERSGGTGNKDDRPSRVVMRSGPPRKPAPHAVPGVSASRAGTVGKADGRPDLERLAARFLGEESDVTALDMALDAASLPTEQIGALMALLADGKMEVRALEILTVRWATVDPEAALAFALGREELAGGDAVPRIVGGLAGTDLPAAEAALARLKKEMRTNAERAIVRVLREEDPRAALAYARGLENEEAEADVLRHMALSDPLAAAAELVSGGVPHRRAVEGIAVSLRAKDRGAFEEWAGSLNDPAQRSMAFSAVLTLDAGTDPRAAALGMAAWLAGDAEASAHARDLATELAGKWTGTGGRPAEVAAWAASLPAGPAQTAAVTEVGSRWIEQDTMAASAWLGSLPPGRGRDNGVVSLVKKISGENPVGAFEWALTTETPGLRADAMGNAVYYWARQDYTAAQGMVETLPAGEQAHLRNMLELAGREKETSERK